MIELVVSLCLVTAPDVCATRLAPQPGPDSWDNCHATADLRVARLAVDHPDIAVAGWTCEPPPMSPLPVVEVAPGVWVHKGLHEVATPENAGDLANIGFIVGQEGVAVIDAGGSRPVAEALLMSIRKVTDLPVRWLVLTHMHPDHVLGASLFVDMGAEVVGHRNLPDALARRAATYNANYDILLGPQRMLLSQVIDPGRITTGLAQIDLGGRVLELEETETAHTDNDLRVYDPATGTLWMADLIFEEHTPALDGSIIGWLAVLEALSSRQAVRAVPGHGPESLPWPDAMQATRTYLTALAAETRAAIAAGESLSQAITHLGESQRGDWLLFDDYNPRNATAAFTELEWE